MDVDLDTFYERFKVLEQEFRSFQALVGPLAAQMQRHAEAAALAPSNPEAARSMAWSHVENGLYDLAGKLIGLDRVTVAGGHGFDEDDSSYERRLRAGLGMMQRPEDGLVDQPPTTSKTPSTIDELEAALKAGNADGLNLNINSDGTISRDAVQLREDGPTVAEYVAAGFLASTYPPPGYASKSTQEEIDAAIAGATPREVPPEKPADPPEQEPAPQTEQEPSSGVNTDAPPVGPGNETN